MNNLKSYYKKSLNILQRKKRKRKVILILYVKCNYWTSPHYIESSRIYFLKTVRKHSDKIIQCCSLKHQCKFGRINFFPFMCKKIAWSADYHSQQCHSQLSIYRYFLQADFYERLHFWLTITMRTFHIFG